MKSWLKKHVILLLMILVGIGAALTAVIPRIGVDRASKTYDILLEYASLEDMAEDSEYDVEFWLSWFRELGLEKLAIQEETVSSLVKLYPGVLRAETVSNIYSVYGWQERYPEEVREMIRASEYATDVLVSCEDEELFAWIVRAFQNRSDGEIRVWVAENGDGFLLLSGDGENVTGSKLITMPLGLDPEKTALAEKYGYTVVARTITVAGVNGEAFAQGVLTDHAQLDMPYFISGGSGLPGYDQPETALARMQEFLETEDVTLGVVETSTQSMNMVTGGVEELVEQSGYQAIRVFTMWDYVQYRFAWYGYDGPEEITNSLYRAVYERNCRLIYLKMMKEQKDDGTTPYVTDPEQYAVLLNGLSSRLAERGYTMETVVPAEQVSVSFGASVLMAMGAVAAAVLLLGLVIPLSGRLTWLLALLGSGAAACVLYVMPNTGRLVLNIGGGIVMPLLAMVALSRILSGTAGRRTAIEAVLAALGVAAVSLVGALFASAPLSDSAYLLEMKLYRGVKVMQLVPLAGFLLFSLGRYCQKPLRAVMTSSRAERRAAMERALDTTVKVRAVLWVVAAAAAAAVLAAVGGYYLSRTGNSGSVGTLELQFRSFLEEALVVRPRTKEFLIGCPCMMLYVWSRRKGGAAMEALGVIFGLGAVIGATSIVNTFLHIRTAFLLSLTRVGLGLAFGLVIGLAALGIAEGIHRLIKKKFCRAAG